MGVAIAGQLARLVPGKNGAVDMPAPKSRSGTDVQLSFCFESISASLAKAETVSLSRPVTAVACLATRRLATSKKEDVDAYTRILTHARSLRKI